MKRWQISLLLGVALLLVAAFVVPHTKSKTVIVVSTSQCEGDLESEVRLRSGDDVWYGFECHIEVTDVERLGMLLFVALLNVGFGFMVYLLNPRLLKNNHLQKGGSPTVEVRCSPEV